MQPTLHKGRDDSQQRVTNHIAARPSPAAHKLLHCRQAGLTAPGSAAGTFTTPVSRAQSISEELGSSAGHTVCNEQGPSSVASASACCMGTGHHAGAVATVTVKLVSGIDADTHLMRSVTWSHQSPKMSSSLYLRLPSSSVPPAATDSCPQRLVWSCGQAARCKPS